MIGAQPLDVQAMCRGAACPAWHILEKGREGWLKNDEVYDLLCNFRAYGLKLADKPPHKPKGGALFMFNRNTLRYFRKDGHDWRKKIDGKSVRETHEKLKVSGTTALNCYYAHSIDNLLQRRSYWLLNDDTGVVLVHYLAIPRTPRRCQVVPKKESSAQLSSSCTATPSSPSSLPSSCSAETLVASASSDDLTMCQPVSILEQLALSELQCAAPDWFDFGVIKQESAQSFDVGVIKQESAQSSDSWGLIAPLLFDGLDDCFEDSSCFLPLEEFLRPLQTTQCTPVPDNVMLGNFLETSFANGSLTCSKSTVSDVFFTPQPSRNQMVMRLY